MKKRISKVISLNDIYIIAMVRGLLVLMLLLSFSCKQEIEDKTLKIYHLKPNDITIKESPNSNAWYREYRNDFFVVKHFDLENEQHKIAIDSFIINYIKNDSFLLENEKPTWKLRFFEYGEDITEKTKHEYSTDYTIHNLFAQKKEIANFYFNNRTGYSGSSYWSKEEPRNLIETKRKIITDYFNSDKKLQEKIKKGEAKRGQSNFKIETQDTVKILAQLVRKGIGSKIQIAQYKVLSPIKGLIAIEGDTINVGYSILNEPKNFPKTSILTLVKYDGIETVKNYFIFPNYDAKKGIQPVKN